MKHSILERLFTTSVTFVIVATCLTSTVSGASMRATKRDASFVPAMQVIPLSYDTSGRHTISVKMSSGPSPQEFNFTLSTRSPFAYVAGSGCSTCGGVSLYDQSASTSVKPLSASDNATFPGDLISGTLVKEDCSMRTANGSSWAYPNQTVVVVDRQSSNSILGSEVSGVLGLGTGRLTPKAPNQNYNATPADSIYDQWFSRNPRANNFTFGMALQPHIIGPKGSNNASQTSSGGAAMPTDAGMLHWLQPDTTYYNPDAASRVNVNSQASSGNQTTTQEWTVTLDGWELTSSLGQIKSSASMQAIVEPLYQDIYVPADQARLLFGDIAGSSAAAGASSLGAASQAFSIPCNTKLTFSIISGTQTFSLDESQLVVPQGDGTCLSGIEAWTDPSQETYLLGTRFLSTVYVIFDIPRDGTPSITFASRATKKSNTNVGPIVGGTIGGVALLVIIIVALYYCVSRKRQVKSSFPTPAVYDDLARRPDGSVEPFLLPVQQQSPPPPSPNYMSQVVSPLQSQFHTGNPSESALLGHDGNGMDALPPTYDASVEGTRASLTVASPLPRDVKHRQQPSASSGLSAPSSSSDGRTVA